MIRTTPFHPRLSQLNSQHLYTHWQGCLSPLRYSQEPKHEYFAVRNSVGVFDTSPLYKYRVTGPQSEQLLAGVLTRDVRACRPGSAQYTVWCDDGGFVMEDGVVLREGHDDFWLMTARPALAWLEHHRGRLDVGLEDVTDAYAVLAVQGPRSRAALEPLTTAVNRLRYFEHTRTTLGPAEVMLSRTGYTGDLGFEITTAADDAEAVLDAVLAAGRPHGIRPFGEEALGMLRIEAGLALVDVDFRNSRLVFSDHERITPQELGLGWMLRTIGDDTRPFVGRRAIQRELAASASRWATTGIVVDWVDWNRLHREAGLLPPKSEHPLPYESMLYDAAPGDGGRQIGHATRYFHSPVLQRHVGMARVRPDLAAPGTEVHLEVAVHHRTATVAARTVGLPLYDPPRRKAMP